MARPLGGDIWHLSIDDLLAPLQESPRLGGPGPFVINLSASTAPISQPIKGVLGCPDAHVYQIQRTEDRRLRYRLRLGPFSTEDEALAVLEKVRDIYPGALTATAEAEDLRALEAIQARTAAQTKGTTRPKTDAQPTGHAGQKVHSQPVDGALAKGDSPTLNAVTRPPLVSIPVLSEAVSFARPKSVRSPLPRERRSQVGGTVMDRAPAPAAGAEAKPPVLEPPLTKCLQTQSPPTAAPDVVPWVVEAPGGKPPQTLSAPTAAPEVKPWVAEPPAAAAADAVPWIVEPPIMEAAPAKQPRTPPASAGAPEFKPWVAEPSIITAPPAAAAADTVPWIVEAPTVEPAAVKPPIVKPPIVKPPVSKPAALSSPVARPVMVKSSAVSAAAPKPAEELETKPPSFESTQTIRPLTPLELEDAAASRWFVIQLSIADQAFDPDSVPNLDIFTVYRLYSVAGLEQGRVMHALRLGFFSDEVAAGAVASYLTAFYQTSMVKRVSAAERERFADECFEARKDVGATGQHAVIEITSERVVREGRITSAAPVKSVDASSAPRVAAQKSRWF
ncbi:MAG: SPOR domain-containing protein [Steroidobacteraceae bacterium]